MSNSSSGISDVTFKVLTIGETEVGKTSILLRMTENKFIDRSPPTIGVDFKSKLTKVSNMPIRVNIWDTAGQEKYRKLTRQYYRGANGILIIYDVNSVESFSKISNWVEEIKADVNFNKISLVLVGNKTDLPYRAVSTQQGLALANKLNMNFVEVSALKNENIDTVFTILVHDMIFKSNVYIDNSKNGRISIDKKNINTYVIDGSTPADKRLEMVDSFNQNDDVKVFLIMLKAGGTGLNLIGADTVIHLDLWWNPQAENQATDRAHRIGQTKNVEVIHLISRGTIEEKILELQNKKRILSDKLIDSEVRDTNILNNLSEKDILELISYENKD